MSTVVCDSVFSLIENCGSGIYCWNSVWCVFDECLMVLQCDCFSLPARREEKAKPRVNWHLMVNIDSESYSRTWVSVGSYGTAWKRAERREREREKDNMCDYKYNMHQTSKHHSLRQSYIVHRQLAHTQSVYESHHLSLFGVIWTQALHQPFSTEWLHRPLRLIWRKISRDASDIFTEQWVL